MKKNKTLYEYCKTAFYYGKNDATLFDFDEWFFKQRLKK